VAGIGDLHRLALPEDPATVPRDDPREDPDEGALACAVLPHQPVDLPGEDLQGDPVQGLNARESFGDLFGAQEGFHPLLQKMRVRAGVPPPASAITGMSEEPACLSPFLRLLT